MRDWLERLAWGQPAVLDCGRDADQDAFEDVPPNVSGGKDSERGIPEQAIELELLSLGMDGKATLGTAYEILRNTWHSGDRNRGLSLHLMFLSWYLLIEPPHLTGLDEERVSTDELMAIFNEVHEHMTPVKSGDAEALYVVGLMAHLSPWLLGDNVTWETRSSEYRLHYRALEPNGLDPAVFDGRGAYGAYFAGQVRVEDGY